MTITSAHRRVRRQATTVLSLALLTVAAFPSNSAWATNFSGASGATGCGGVNMADNATHSFWYDSLSTDAQIAVNQTRTSNYNPTDLDTVNEDVPDSLTDVLTYDEDYEGTTCGSVWQSGAALGGLAGFTQCLSLSGSRCQQFAVYFDNDFMGPRSTGDERWLACHEVGHTVGLMHTNTGANCMQSPGVATAVLTAHDISHINTNY